MDKSILAIYKTEGRSYIDAEFSPQEYGVATKKDSGFSAVCDDLITGWLADGTDPPAAERRRHLQRPWNRERFGRDGAVRCGLSAPVPGAFCVREAAFSENAAKLQKKLQFSHQKRRFPIDSLVIIGV